MVKTIYGDLSIEGENLLISYSKYGAESSMVSSKTLHLPSLVAYEFKPAARFQDGLMLFQSDLGRTDIHFNKKQQDEVAQLSMEIEKIAVKARGNKVSGPHDYPSRGSTASNAAPVVSVTSAGEITDTAVYVANAELMNPDPAPMPLKFSDLRGPKKLADFEGIELWESFIKHDRQKYGLEGARAEVEMGASRERVTVTRVGLGALIGGPVGAIVGANSKKSETLGYLNVSTNDGTIVLEFPGKSETQARKFVAQINDAARRVASGR